MVFDPFLFEAACVCLGLRSLKFLALSVRLYISFINCVNCSVVALNVVRFVLLTLLFWSESFAMAALF